MKNKLFNICPFAVTVIGLLFWFLKVVGVNAFSGFTFVYVCVFFFGAYAISNILRGILEDKNDPVLKRTWFILGGAFLVGFTVCLIIAIPEAIDLTVKVVISGILLAIGIAVLVSLIFRGPNKWDKGDNENPEYKTYRERKALEEAEAKKQEESQAKEKEEE